MSTQEAEPPDSRIELPELPEGRSGKGWPATVIVSVAAVIVTATVGVLGIINTRNSQIYEEEKSEREFRLSCVTSAATIATIAFGLSKDFKSMPDDEKINQINIIMASFPPDAAYRLLSALTPRMGNAPSMSVAFQVALGNLTAQDVQEKRLTCPTAPALIASNEALAAPVPVASALPTAPQPPKPANEATAPNLLPLPPPPTAAVQLATRAAGALTVYYQITQSSDLDVAKMLAKDVTDATTRSGTGASFPSAGVEVVSAARPLAQTEVRYYRVDEEAAAQDLLRQLLADAKAKSINLTGRVVFIGGKYPNLPLGRIEVWFQPLTQARQG